MPFELWRLVFRIEKKKNIWIFDELLNEMQCSLS